MATTLIAGGDVLTPTRRLAGGHVVIAGDKILYAGRERPPLLYDQVIDATGLTVAPGFIDLQVNGIAGHDLMEGTVAAVAGCAAALPRYGVTAFLPTVVTGPRRAIAAGLAAVSAYMDHPAPGTAAVLGAHVEGPYIAQACRGAHDPAWIRPFDPGEWREWWSAARGRIRLTTLAPEVPENLAAVRGLAAAGVVVSCGHSDAAYEQVAAAAMEGLRAATHTFNGMRGLHHREPGAAGAVMALDGICAGLIADGVHVHPAVAAALVRAKGPDRVYLVSDSVMVAGLPPGRYRWLGREIVSDGVAPRLADGGGLAGSLLTLDRAVANVARWPGMTLRRAVQMAALTPARLLGEAGRRGRLTPGRQADLVLLDRRLAVVRTIIAGQTVYEA